jgi:Fe-S-cluster containining protein
MDWARAAWSFGEAGVCSRCAEQGSTCCVLTPGNEDLCFPVSTIERHRIEEQIGLDRGAFTLEPNSVAFRDSMLRMFPNDGTAVELLFPEGGTHARLSCDKEGRCVFLRRSGCLLPRPARPYYCRLFPLWVTGERITVFSAAGCLARREAQDLAAILDLLKCAAFTAFDLHGRLRLAWGLPPKEGLPCVTPSRARFPK